MLHRLRQRGDDGVTLVEVVVAMTLFAVLLSTVAVALSSMLKNVRNNQNRTVAANIATRVIDRLHAIPASQLPTSTLPTQTFRAGSAVFKVESRVAAVAEAAVAGAGACDGGGALSAKSVHVEVSWTGMGTTRPVVSDTLRRLTVDELDMTKGSLSVRVVDRAGVAVSGQALTLNPGGRTATTAADGCAVFSAVPAGSYTVAVVARAGFVDPLGAAAPARSVTISGGNLTRDDGFRYDDDVSVQATWVGGSLLSTHPILIGMGLTVGNATFTGGARAHPICGSSPCATGLPGSTATTGARVDGLFPFAEGVRVWAGNCADSTPTATPTAVVLAPGAAAVVDVPVAPVAVFVFDRNGAARNGQDVTIRHVADGGCAAITQVIRAPGGTNRVQFSVPAGTWSFSSGGGTPVTVAIQPGGTTATSVNVRQA